MSVLKVRHSTRECPAQPLPLQLLSDMLWAAFGANRPNGDRTAPYWGYILVIDASCMAGHRICRPACPRTRRAEPNQQLRVDGNRDKSEPMMLKLKLERMLRSAGRNEKNWVDSKD